ncbi:MAG: site-specific integrase [Clostridia bacterium]|nr:site-specific integrase [Clostridia bacterium]
MESFLYIILTTDKKHKLIFTSLYLTGMRKGEALALTWGDIDFHRKEIKVAKSLNRKRPKKGGDVILTSHPETPSSFGWHVSKTRSYEITTPKNRASYRQILMPNNLYDMTYEHYVQVKQDYGFSNNIFVFGGEVPVSDQTLRRRFDSYAQKAGVKKIRIHDLRHSHASLLINKGQNILIVSKRLGHSNITQTLNTYSHLMPNMQLEIVGALNIDIK